MRYILFCCYLEELEINMEYHYTLTKDDYVAFNMHHAQHSERVQKVLRVQRWMSLIFLFIPLLVSWIEGEFLVGMFAAFALLAVLWFLFYPKYFYGSIKKNIIKVMNEEGNSSLTGEHTIMVTEDGLVEKSSKGEVKTPWSSITQIRETDEHIFILVSAMSGYVIPINTFADVKALQQFKETLNAARDEKTG